VSAAKAKKAKDTGTTKPVKGKPSSKPAAPRGPLARAKSVSSYNKKTFK
jgi:hypothetical protein